MRKFKLTLIVLYKAIDYSIRSVLQTTKGQIPRYEILQLSHRLEKGLLIKEPKPLWGWEKANRIADLIRENSDAFSNSTGKGVLKAYLEAKKKCKDIRDRKQAEVFVKNFNDILQVTATSGGTCRLEKKEVTIADKKSVIQLFMTRHSTREYAPKQVEKVDLDAAIALAMRCPSACNRQVTHCYIYQSSDRQSIFLTVNVRAYDIGEFNDWIVSPSIFAAYLSLSLHLYGIGSCIYRKQLYGKKANKEIKKRCGIPDNEMVVLEIQFGYYREEFDVAVSNRTSLDDITTYILD